MSYSVRVEGIERITEKLAPAYLLGPPVRDMFNGAAIVVQGHARENAPVDKGQLRNSIAFQVDAAEVPLWASVYTNVVHAAPQEFGTRPGHFPPPAALDAWARSHGFPNGFVVARAISRTGIKPKFYMKRALEQSKNAISGLVSAAEKAIGERWG